MKRYSPRSRCVTASKSCNACDFSAPTSPSPGASTVCTALACDCRTASYPYVLVAQIESEVKSCSTTEQSNMTRYAYPPCSYNTRNVEALQQDNARLFRENAALRNLCRNNVSSRRGHAEDCSNCTTSIAFDDTNGRRDIRQKYQTALRDFLRPLKEKYDVTIEQLSSPQPCRFLLWVTFVGGRLPDESPRFEEFAAQAGNHTS